MAEKVNFSSARASNASPVETPFAEIGLQVGDVVQLGTNADGELDTINMVYRHDQTSDKGAFLKDDTYSLSFGGYEGEGGACGTVVKVDATNGILQFAIFAGTEKEATYNISTSGAGCSIYRWNNN